MRQRWNIWFYKMIEYLGLCPSMVRMPTFTNTARRERYYRGIYKNNSIGPDCDYSSIPYNFKYGEFTANINGVCDEFWAENNNGQSPQNVSQIFDCL